VAAILVARAQLEDLALGADAELEKYDLGRLDERWKHGVAGTVPSGHATVTTHRSLSTTTTLLVRNRALRHLVTYQDAAPARPAGSRFGSANRATVVG